MPPPVSTAAGIPRLGWPASTSSRSLCVHATPPLRHEVEQAQNKYNTFLYNNSLDKWKASKLQHCDYGENCGKLLAWKASSDNARNYIQEMEQMGTAVKLLTTAEIKEELASSLRSMYQEDSALDIEIRKRWLPEKELL
ncbi:hypothetical protein NDU88_004685 [Pleurodeles waltl]|uniref:Uncharacterized protein n=1 Tax=Pleurodeles waltl TaxID=8319 RepID=A0AAV7SJM3_PLEWA|nr:hypothetical protein NDU88_004685 [Pleurodeles waltl]